MPTRLPSFNNCKFLSKNKVETFPSTKIFSFPLESIFFAKSYCDNFCFPVTYISLPKGGLLNETENVPNLIFCCVNSFQFVGFSKLSSQKIPPFPSPKIAI